MKRKAIIIIIPKRLSFSSWGASVPGASSKLGE